jgi:hypothetical protein
MRLLFFLLILANLLFYGWHAGYIGPGDVKKGEGERLTQQLAPEKIRIVTPDEAKKIREAVKTRVNACFEWGTFPAQEAEKATEALAALNLGNRLVVRTVEETAGWWVFMPPQGNKANADKKVEELKRLGISDFFIVQDEGPNKFAISLGVFRTEDAAKSYLATIAARGVKTARADQRETKVQKTIYRLSGLDEASTAKFDVLKKDFPGHDAKDCAADEGKLDNKADKKPDEKKSDDKKG